MTNVGTLENAGHICDLIGARKRTMPIEINFTGTLLTLRFLGRIEAKDLVEGTLAIEEIEASSPTAPDRIFTFADGSELAVGFEAIEAVAIMRNSARLKNGIRTAVVATGELQFGMARMFQSLVTNPQITIRIFRDPESATSWLASKK